MDSHDETLRREHDALGELDIPAGAYYGIHTMRAVRNFPFSGYRLHAPFIKALALVKQACAATNAALGHLDREQSEAIMRPAGKWKTANCPTILSWTHSRAEQGPRRT